MARTMLSSMWWRRCRGLLHRLQLGETLSCFGLSNFSKLADSQTGVGLRHIRALPTPLFWAVATRNLLRLVGEGRPGHAAWY